ncbi:hypothetical protein [Mycolicibacterium sp. HS_4_1]
MTVLAALAAGCDTVRETAAEVTAKCTREAMYKPEMLDRKSFVNIADNVFVGHVDRKTGQHVEDRELYSLFDVKVIQNLKGNLAGTVTVSQIGGSVFGKQCLMNSDPILSENATYIFTTQYSKDLNIHFILAARLGDIRLSDAEAAALTSGGQEPPIVAEFRTAIGKA